MMTEYKPDSWVIIKMTHNEQTFYKVLGGWSGGYLNGTSWRLNSGVEKVSLDNDRYMFYGSSGSVYSCHKETYGLKMSTAGIWDQMKEKFSEQVELLEDRDWSAMEWK
jgi:hypothetical protein